MILTKDETAQFYRIWFPLLRHTNLKCNLLPTDFAADPSKTPIKQEDAHQVRNALWQEDSILETFVAANPANLSQEDLKLAANWKIRVAGSFFIMRHLKKYSIFLEEGGARRLFGVVGLASPIEEILGDYVPRYVNAVLLPFNDKIIYDSLLSSYQIYFGGGITSDLKRDYKLAEERYGIMTSLLELNQALNPAEARKKKEGRNAKLLKAFSKALYKSGISPKMTEQQINNIALFGDVLLRRDEPISLYEINEQNTADYLRALDAKQKKNAVTSLKRFVTFMQDTDRIDYGEGWDIRDFLKVYAKLK